MVARKPLAGTVAQTVLAYGTGALNVDGCRVGDGEAILCHDGSGNIDTYHGGWANTYEKGTGRQYKTGGRWPSNVVLSHAPDCDGGCAPGCPVAALDAQSGETASKESDRGAGKGKTATFGEWGLAEDSVRGHNDSGGASRFFPTFDADPPFMYTAKAGTAERVRDERAGEGEGRVTGLDGLKRRCRVCGSQAPQLDQRCGHDDYEWVPAPQRPDHVAHPTVKPLALMRWLVRLVTPPLTPDGLPGLVLDPFAGSGTTAEAALLEGFRCVTVEREAEYLPLILQRLNRRRDPVAYVRDKGGDGGLFDLLDADGAR